MIPLQLHIKNFLSYGSPTQTINFEPYHLICLSGKNGHGKSALLDALTWAVWGHARKTTATAKADDGLLRLGQTHMVVSFDFMAHHQTYRVRREYSLDRGKATTQLDFGVVDRATDKLRSLTDKTIRGTQEVINTTVGLDYDAFVNSVFLRQGQSNEFSKKSPKDRKEILVNILGLAHYELLRKRALEKMREEKLRSEHLALRVQQLVSMLAILPEKQTALEQHLTQAVLLQKQLTELHEKNTAVVTAKNNLVRAQQEAIRLDTQHTLFTQENIKKKQELVTVFTSWRAAHKVFLGKNTEELHKKLQLLQAEFTQLQELINKRMSVIQEQLIHKEQGQHLETQLQKTFFEEEKKIQEYYAEQNKKLQEYAQQQATVTATLTHLEHQKKTLAAALQLTTEQTKKLHVQQPELAQQEVLFERRKQFYHAFVARGNLVAATLKEIAHKQAMASDSANPSCSLCEQNLSASRRRFMQTQFSQHQHRLEHQLQRLAIVIKNLKELLTTQHAELTALRKNVHDMTQAQVRSEELTQLLSTVALEHAKIQEQLLKLQTEYKARTAELENFRNKNTRLYEMYKTTSADYTAHQARDAELTLLLTTFTYDEKKYTQLQQDIAHYTALLQTDTAHSSTQAQQQRRQALILLCSELRQLKKQLHELAEQKMQYQTLNEQLHHNACELERVEKEITTLHEQRDLYARACGGLEQECKQLLQYQKDHAALQVEHEQLQDSQDDYTVLAQAFSKDGIQGLLIEHILPELETEANHLLSRLTNNQAHISIESMRDLKSGGSRETLDIKISDALGIRPYEMFSGGEAFRIDFALRLALSKLLARRTGSALQTLIIDEGFGSQDDEGLNHIMEALYAIQDEFAKIIVVSHLPAMKDQFPVHFVVQKTPRGSLVQAIEQG